MLPKYELSLISRLLLIWLTIRRFSAAQMYYEDDSCDFGIYKGICLRASKCLELPVVMKEISLKSTDVGHCGFTATEEIICCPTRQVPVPAARELSNNLADILKPFEFRAPPEDETTRSSIQSVPAGFWFSNNFKEGNKDESAVKSDDEMALVRTPKADESARVQSIFSGNQMPNQSPSPDGGIDEDTARRINDIFSMKPVPQGTPIEENTRGINGIRIENSNTVRVPNNDDTQKIEPIFNINSLPGRPLTAIATDRINAIFNEELVPVENKVNVIDPTLARTRQINSIFSGNPIASESASLNIDSDTAKRINDIFNTNTTPSGVRIEDNTQVIDGSKVPLGNINSNKTPEINFSLNGNVLSNGVPIEDNPRNMNDLSAHVRWPNAFQSQNNGAAIQHSAQKTDSVFNGGSIGDDVTRRINSIFNTNPAPHPIIIQGDVQKINTIFNGNSVQTGTQINNDPFHNFLKPSRNERLPANQRSALPLTNEFRPQFEPVELQ